MCVWYQRHPERSLLRLHHWLVGHDQHHHVARWQGDLALGSHAYASSSIQLTNQPIESHWLIERAWTTLVYNAVPPPPSGAMTIGELLKYKASHGCQVVVHVWNDATSVDAMGVTVAAGIMHTGDEVRSTDSWRILAPSMALDCG